MKILAIDTATAACSAALMGDGAIIAARHEEMLRGHAEALLPMVEAVMAEADVAYGALDLIATTIGPGAFTGLRVGLAAARGLALAGGLPIIGVTTLEALAHAVPAGERGERSVVAVINARREEVYYQPFDALLSPLGPPRVGAAQAIDLPKGPLLLLGGGAAILAAPGNGNGDGKRSDIEIIPGLLPDAAVVAAIAAARFDPAAPTSSPPEPLYLRGSGARAPTAPS